MLKALLLCIATFIAGSPMNARADDAPLLKSSHFAFYAHGNATLPAVQELADAVEHDYDKVLAAFDTVPAKDLQVHVYADQWRYALATGNFNASGSIAGTARVHLVQQPDDKKVVVHEFVHAVVLKMLIDRAPQPFDEKAFDQKFKTFPVWLWESLAVYEAGQFLDPRTLRYLAKGQYPRLAELSERARGGKAYAVGYTIIEYILEQHGKEKLLSLIANYGDVPATLALSDEEFAAAWYRFVQEKYLKAPQA